MLLPWTDSLSRRLLDVIQDGDVGCEGADKLFIGGFILSRSDVESIMASVFEISLFLNCLTTAMVVWTAAVANPAGMV